MHTIIDAQPNQIGLALHLIQNDFLLDLPHGLVEVLQLLGDITDTLDRALVSNYLVPNFRCPQTSFRQVPVNAKRITSFTQSGTNLNLEPYVP